MPRKKNPEAHQNLSPAEEIKRKIEYHKNCIEKLEKKLAAMNKPSRKQMTALLEKVDGMSMEEIAEKLGVKLD